MVIAEEDFETWLNGEVEDAAKLIRPAPDGTFMLKPAEISHSGPKPKPNPLPNQLKLI